MGKWSLQFFNLCITFMNMSPPILKKKFSNSYENVLKSIDNKQFLEQNEQNIFVFFEMLLLLTDYHISK